MTTHRSAVFVTLAAVLGFGAPLSAQGSLRVDSGSVIETSGTGEINLSPDRATIRLAVETRAATAAAASAGNSTRLRRVLDSLNAFRAPEESVQVVGVSVRPNENYQSGTLTGYIATASLRITIRSLERLGPYLDRALGAGATIVAGITYHSDREAAARQDALGQAYREARGQAEALARAAGVRLGALVRIATEPQYDFAAAYEGVGFAAGLAARTPVPIGPQDVRVRASVLATWRIEPR